MCLPFWKYLFKGATIPLTSKESLPSLISRSGDRWHAWQILPMEINKFTHIFFTTQLRLLNGLKRAGPIDLHGPHRTTGPVCNIHRQSTQTTHIQGPIRQNMHHRGQRPHKSLARTIVRSIKHCWQIRPPVCLDERQHFVRIHHAPILGPSGPTVAELVLTLRIGTPVYCCAGNSL